MEDMAGANTAEIGTETAGAVTDASSAKDPQTGKELGGEGADTSAAPVDPEIELDLEGADGKPQKLKLKASQAAERLSRASRIERQAIARQKEIEDLWQKEIAPYKARQEALKRDPMLLFKLAEEMGIDPESAARKFAEDYVRRQDMTPEQREIERLKAEAAALRERQEQDEQRQQQEAQQQEMQQTRARVEQEITTAAAKYGLPKHPMALALLNSFAAAQVRAGMQEPDFGLAAENVGDFARDYLKAWITPMSYEQVVKEFPDLLKKVREGDLKAATAGRPVPPSKPRTPEPQQKTVTPEEWRERVVSRLT